MITLVMFNFTEETFKYCSNTETKEFTINYLGEEYTYNSSTITEINFILKKQFKEFEVPLSDWGSYKFIFNVKSLKQPINIEIYDKKYSAKDRKLLFSSRDNTNHDGIFYFITDKPYKKVFIDYGIPPTKAENYSGCVLMVAGFKHE